MGNADIVENEEAIANSREQSLLPIFVKIAGKSCLVVGAGHAALKKIEALLGCGARIQVVAEHAIDPVRELARQELLQLSIRRYSQEDLAGVFLVIAATNDPEVNQTIFCDAKERKILINAVDSPPQCDFYFPAIVRRGSLQVAISTSGQSPAFAQKLKEDIDSVLPLSLGKWLERLGRIRRNILQTVPPGDARTQILTALANGSSCIVPQSKPEGTRLATNDEQRVMLQNAKVAKAGSVYFIDVASDDPDLLTLRAASLLATADVVVYDQAIPSSILEMRDPTAAVVSVTPSGPSAQRSGHETCACLIKSAKSGFRVARLRAINSNSCSTGDEEIAEIHTAMVPFEVVPGISRGCGRLPSWQQAAAESLATH